MGHGYFGRRLRRAMCYYALSKPRPIPTLHGTRALGARALSSGLWYMLWSGGWWLVGTRSLSHLREIRGLSVLVYFYLDKPDTRRYSPISKTLHGLGLSASCGYWYLDGPI